LTMIAVQIPNFSFKLERKRLIKYY